MHKKMARTIINIGNNKSRVNLSTKWVSDSISMHVNTYKKTFMCCLKETYLTQTDMDNLKMIGGESWYKVFNLPQNQSHLRSRKVITIEGQYIQNVQAMIK